MNSFTKKELTYNLITFQTSSDPIPTEREIHDYHEVLYYTGGETDFLTEEGQHPLRPRSLLIIPRNTYHFFRSRDRFERLKICVPSAFLQATPFAPLFNKLLLVDRPEEGVSFALERLCKAAAAGSAFHAYCAFLMLLCELEQTDTRQCRIEFDENGCSREIASYVSRHLADDLSIGTLSRALGLSVSTVTHTFKKEMGIPLHEYILQRRLMLAQHRIAGGRKPTEIYVDCGFGDYSSFYKAYCRFFGYSPSKETKHPPQN